MKIAFDVMGGDLGPSENIKGVIEALKIIESSIILVGDENIIKSELENKEYDKSRIEILNASDKIDSDEEPVRAIRRKKESSMVKALELVKEKKAEGIISSGNTGALLAGGLFKIGRIKGIDRPALAPIIPTPIRPSVLIDGGANTECKPINLLQFAKMGEIYSRKVLKIESPKVGLVNVGVEETKGNSLVKESYKLLKESDLNFHGNLEARDIPQGKVDVITCDGFTGNVVLKLTEGMANTMFSVLKREFTKTFFNKMAALILKKGLKNIKNEYDYKEYGGAPFLGVKGAVIKAHGSSDKRAIKNAFKQCETFIKNEVILEIEKSIEE